MHVGSSHGRVLNVVAAVETVRAAHPDLASGAKPNAVWRAIKDEGIQVRRGRIARKGRSSKFDGDAVITLRNDLPPRESWKWALHEWGHIRMHFPEHGEYEKNLSACTIGDPREDEATLFAVLVHLGEAATIEHPIAAAVVAKMVAREYRRRSPEQLPLELPEKAPVYKPLAEPFASEREYERGLVQRGAKNLRPKGQRIFRDVPTADDERRIKWYDETKGTTRFEDITGRQWWIYNLRKNARGVTPRWAKVGDFMDPVATHRLFVNGAGARRLYQFANEREQRAYRTKHLDRQLAQARILPPKRDGLRAILTRAHR